MATSIAPIIFLTPILSLVTSFTITCDSIGVKAIAITVLDTPTNAIE
jgi:hypothetical protein